MSDVRLWIAQIFSPNISCGKLVEIGRAIAQDKTLTESNKFVLRNLWKAKYNICKIDEGSASNERSNS